VSSEEVYQKLKNDPEFLHKLAEILKPEVALIVLEEFRKLGDELKEVNENLKTLNDRANSLDKRVEKLENKQEETNKRLESLEDWQKKAVSELVDIKKTLKILAKQQNELINAIANVSEDLEDDARDYLTHKLKNEYNIEVPVIPFEIENVFQFDIFADLGDKLILGEVKIRAGSKTVKQLEKAIEKLLKAKPEFKKKKIIPMIYARRFTKALVEECKRKEIYLTTGYKDLTPLKLE